MAHSCDLLPQLDCTPIIAAITEIVVYLFVVENPSSYGNGWVELPLMPSAALLLDCASAEQCNDAMMHCHSVPETYLTPLSVILSAAERGEGPSRGTIPVRVHPSIQQYS